MGSGAVDRQLNSVFGRLRRWPTEMDSAELTVVEPERETIPTRLRVPIEGEPRGRKGAARWEGEAENTRLLSTNHSNLELRRTGP